MNEITILFKKYIIDDYYKYNTVYSDEHTKKQQQIIDEFEECRKRNNYTVNDIRLTDFSFNTIPLFALLNQFAHPIFCQYFIDTYYTPEFIKENTAKIQDTFKWLYISIRYGIIAGRLYYYKLKENELFYLLDEYARILNITYQKETYERTE